MPRTSPEVEGAVAGDQHVARGRRPAVSGVTEEHPQRVWVWHAGRVLVVDVLHVHREGGEAVCCTGLKQWLQRAQKAAVGDDHVVRRQVTGDVPRAGALHPLGRRDVSAIHLVAMRLERLEPDLARVHHQAGQQLRRARIGHVEDAHAVGLGQRQHAVRHHGE